MAEIKDKIVTVESLSALHEHNKEDYMAKVDPTGSGSLSINRKADSAIGYGSVAVGYNTEATAMYANAEGYVTIASGKYSHAEGQATTASESASHAEGVNTTASGMYSHAEGSNSVASGMCAHAEGTSTIAASNNQHVQGRYNAEDNMQKYVHVVGNGNSDDARSNAYTLDWDGNAWYSGSVEAPYFILKSSTENSTKRFKVTVDDSGALTATEI